MTTRNQTAEHASRGSAKVAFLILLVGLLASAAGLYVGLRWHDRLAAMIGRQAVTQGQAQLWTCGMHPQVIQDHPGTCPICGMALTPMSPGAGGSSSGGVAAAKPIVIDPIVVQNMGVRVAQVSEGPLRRTIRATGIVEDAQPNITDISLRVSGFIEKLYADTEGKRIGAGEPLLEIYSPEMQVGAQELVTAKRVLDSLPPDSDPEQVAAAGALISVAARKLEQWGLTKSQIDAIAGMATTPRTVTLLSPASGDIIDKAVAAGSSVQAGERLMRLVDRSTLWINARMFEQHLPFVHVGQKVRASIATSPRETFDGEVSFIDPRVDQMTRAATVRLVVSNPEGRLRSGIYANVTIEAEALERAILVPREAVIDTGTRQIVFIALDGGQFEPRRVRIGLPADDGLVQVIEGVAPDERIVVSGQFLLDSESRLREGVEKYLREKQLGSGAESQDESRISGVSVSPVQAAAAWRPECDVIFRNYLAIAQKLGEPQTSNAAVDVESIIAASEAFARESAGDPATKATALAQAARDMRGKTLADQREQFKTVSDAAIALAALVPPSRDVAAHLFIVHCPMAPGNWLQTSDEVANPFYATSMKACGEITGKIHTQEKPHDQKDH